MGLKLIGAILLVGYLTFGRSFAYIGIAPLKFYIGEAILLGFLLVHPKAWLDRWLDGLTKTSRLSAFCWALLLFSGYGVVLVIRGLTGGRNPVSTLENLAFNYYPLYLFLGLWLASRGLDLIAVMRRLAWIQGIYGLLFISVLSHSTLHMPGAENVVLFGPPLGSGLAMVALFCRPMSALSWIPVGLNAVTLLSLQVRAEWVAFFAALLIVSLLKRIQAGMTALLVIATLLGIGYLVDFNIPGPRGEISTRNIVVRSVSIWDSDSDATNAKVYRGTAVWRQKWWALIWSSIHSNDKLMLFGYGYGFPLSFLAPFIKDPAIRTPHNIFFYALGYGGWVGVLSFAWLQLTLLSMHIRAFKRTGDPLGIALTVLFLIEACFSNLLETPFGAIPYYLLSGICLGPLFAKVPVMRAAVSAAPRQLVVRSATS